MSIFFVAVIYLGVYLAFVLSNEDKQKLKYPLNILKEKTRIDEKNPKSAYEDISALHITLRQVCDDFKPADVSKTTNPSTNTSNATKNHSIPLSQLITIMDKWHDVYASGEVTVYADSLCRFLNGNNTVDWIGLSQSFPLYRIKKEFETIANDLGIILKEENFSYTPHITLGFGLLRNDLPESNLQGNDSSSDSQEPSMSDLQLAKFVPIPLTIKKVALWANDNMIGNTHVSSTVHEVSLNFQ